MKTRRIYTSIAIYGLLAGIGIFMIFPMYWMIRSSFMTESEILTVPIIWIPKTFRFRNYVEAFQKAPFLRYMINSFILVAVNVIGQVLSSSFVAFGFTRINFRGRDFWFGLLLTTMMIPYSVLMIPQFVGWMKIGAYDTFIPLMLPAFFGSAFYIFLVRQFYMGIPMEYDEAALVDGANYLTIYSRIIIPMSKPALCTVGVFTFMFTWNDFLGPLLYLDKEILKTVSLGLQVFIGQNITRRSLLMAASTVCMVPMIIVFFLAQRYFIEGITFTGLKG